MTPRGVGLMAMLICASSASAQAARRPASELPHVVIDGRFGDWEGIAPAAVANGGAMPGSPVELREVRVRHDAGSIFLYLDLGRAVVPQAIAGTVEIVLDADGDPATGATTRGIPGADVEILLSPRIRGRSGAVSMVGTGVVRVQAGVPVDSAEILPADTAGVVFAPSVATWRIEIRIARRLAITNGPALLAGGRFTGKVVALDTAGRVAAETGAFTHALGAAPERPVAPGHGDADPLARAPGTSFRLLSWNVNGEGLNRNPEPFRRALAALRPDVVMLDEVLPDSRAVVDGILAALPSAPGAGLWHVVWGQAGGRQRGVVASRLPLQAARAMARVPYPDSIAGVLRSAPAAVAADVDTASGVPTAGVVVTVDGHRILLATVDLKCCGGGADSPEERIRRIEARAMAAAIRSAGAAERADAVIVAGDYNLVGTQEPLEIVRVGAGAASAPLRVADAPRLDGLSYATWMRPRNRFAPGRLDYHLFTGETLVPRRSFAFDAADLSARWLAAHGLHADDSVAASGHRPVVTDFAWAARR